MNLCICCCEDLLKWSHTFLDTSLIVPLVIFRRGLEDAKKLVSECFFVLAGQPLFSAPKAPRSPSIQPDLSPMLQNGHGHPGQADQPWTDTLLRNLSLDASYSHVGLPPSGSGIDPTHLAQQLEQLEIQHLQRMGSSGSALQRQLSGVSPSPQSSRINLDQLMRPEGIPPRDHQGLNPLHSQMPPQSHQAPVPIPPSGPVLEQLLRMQQQQQQQQQLPTQVRCSGGLEVTITSAIFSAVCAGTSDAIGVFCLFRTYLIWIRW